MGEPAYHIKHWFGQIAIQLCQAVGKFGNINGDELIWVLYPVI